MFGSSIPVICCKLFQGFYFVQFISSVIVVLTIPWNSRPRDLINFFYYLVFLSLNLNK